MEGWFNKISQASLGWLILMGKHDEFRLKHLTFTTRNLVFRILSELLEQFYSDSRAIKQNNQL